MMTSPILKIVDLSKRHKFKYFESGTLFSLQIKWLIYVMGFDMIKNVF